MTGAVPTCSASPRRFSVRVFDVVVAGGALVLTLPILVLVAVAIKLDSRGPLVDREVRVGRDGVVFELLTFRSSAADSAVTRPGRLLRRTSIDQLPLLWNVVRGDLGLFGPHPRFPTLAENVSTEDTAPPQVLPGITGLWALSDRQSAS